jgi:hypothetical protein
MPAAKEERVPDALSLFASRLSQHRCTSSAPTGHHLAPQSNPSLSLSLCFRTAGLLMTNSGHWRPHFLPAPTSPRCSPRARLPGVSCELVRRRRSSSPPGGVTEDHARSLSVADFFARAFALVGDVEVSTLYSGNRDQLSMAGAWGVAALCIYALPCSRLGGGRVQSNCAFRNCRMSE